MRRSNCASEKENLVFPIALANLVLHGIDQPNLWHGNTLTATPTYAGLFGAAPGRFQVIFTNPPFGGKEGDDAQQRFPFRTGATQVLFLQQIMTELAEDGRCGIVLDFSVETKHRLKSTQGKAAEQTRVTFDGTALTFPGWTFHMRVSQSSAASEVALPRLVDGS
ncbi:MAG: SAM-dependent DNA methyltransferase [Thiocapsa sp.]|nr:N-6 DNA methylase [Thiocapsa sp.]QVL51264.1 MAG: SAM-dependent DNA methyltransferase [Thiocapsa sp.]